MEKFQRLTEKEKLELLEKQVDIQKKRVEIRKDLLDANIRSRERQIAIEDQSLVNDKIWSLTLLLALTTIDDEKTILGSEPFKKPILNREERKKVSAKLMSLVEKL